MPDSFVSVGTVNTDVGIITSKFDAGMDKVDARMKALAESMRVLGRIDIPYPTGLQSLSNGIAFIRGESATTRDAVISDFGKIAQSSRDLGVTLNSSVRSASAKNVGVWQEEGSTRRKIETETSRFISDTERRVSEQMVSDVAAREARIEALINRATDLAVADWNRQAEERVAIDDRAASMRLDIQKGMLGRMVSAEKEADALIIESQKAASLNWNRQAQMARYTSQSGGAPVPGAYGGNKGVNPGSEVAGASLIGRLGTGALIATAVAAIPTALAAKFEFGSQVLANNSRMTQAQIDSNRKLALAVSTQYGEGVNDVFAGEKNISDFGYKGGAFNAILDRATAMSRGKGAPEADTATALASFMREYNITSVKLINQTANEVSKAANYGAGQTLAQIDAAWKRPMAVLASYGVSQAEGFGLLTTATQHGYTGAQGGTQVRGLIHGIVAGLTNKRDIEGIEHFKQVTGVDLTKYFGAEGLAKYQPSGLLNEINSATQGYSESSRAQLISNIFQNKGQGGDFAVSLANKARSDYQENLSGMSTAGGSVTADAASLNATGIGAVTYRWNKFINDLITVGMPLIPRFAEVAGGFLTIADDVIPPIVNIFGKLPNAAQDAIIAFGALKGAGMLLNSLVIGGSFGGTGLMRGYARENVGKGLFGGLFKGAGERGSSPANAIYVRDAVTEGATVAGDIEGRGSFMTQAVRGNVVFTALAASIVAGGYLGIKYWDAVKDHAQKAKDAFDKQNLHYTHLISHQPDQDKANAAQNALSQTLHETSKPISDFTGRIHELRLELAKFKAEGITPHVKPQNLYNSPNALGYPNHYLIAKERDYRNKQKAPGFMQELFPPMALGTQHDPAAEHAWADNEAWQKKITASNKSWFSGFIKSWGDSWDKLRDSTNKHLNNLPDSVSSHNAAMHSSGESLMKSFADGMVNAENSVKGTLDSVLAWMDRQLPHSDPKEGHLQHLTASGKSFMTTLAEGVRQGGGEFQSEVDKRMSAAQESVYGKHGRSHKGRKPRDYTHADASAVYSADIAADSAGGDRAGVAIIDAMKRLQTPGLSGSKRMGIEMALNSQLSSIDATAAKKHQEALIKAANALDTFNRESAGLTSSTLRLKQSMDSSMLRAQGKDALADLADAKQVAQDTYLSNIQAVQTQLEQALHVARLADQRGDHAGAVGIRSTAYSTSSAGFQEAKDLLGAQTGVANNNYALTLADNAKSLAAFTVSIQRQTDAFDRKGLDTPWSKFLDATDDLNSKIDDQVANLNANAQKWFGGATLADAQASPGYAAMFQSIAGLGADSEFTKGSLANQGGFRKDTNAQSLSDIKDKADDDRIAMEMGKAKLAGGISLREWYKDLQDTDAQLLKLPKDTKGLNQALLDVGTQMADTAKALHEGIYNVSNTLNTVLMWTRNAVGSAAGSSTTDALNEAFGPKKKGEKRQSFGSAFGHDFTNQMREKLFSAAGQIVDNAVNTGIGGLFGHLFGGAKIGKQSATPKGTPGDPIYVAPANPKGGSPGSPSIPGIPGGLIPAIPGKGSPDSPDYPKPSWLQKNASLLETGGLALGDTAMALGAAGKANKKSGLLGFLGGALGLAAGSFIPGLGLLGGAKLGMGIGSMFAAGGSPPVGKISLVGEHGPELFVPHQAGTIVPHGQFGGSGGVNISIVHHGDNVNQGDVAGMHETWTNQIMRQLAVSTPMVGTALG